MRNIETFAGFGRMVERQRAIDGMLAGKGLDLMLERHKADELRKLWREPDEDRWLKLARLNREEWKDDRLGQILMAVATANFTQMGGLVGSTAGAVESLPGVNLTGGRQRTWIDTLTLNSQASGTVFGVARLPLFATLLCIEVLTSISLGTATIAFGDANAAAAYAAAGTLTAVNTVTRLATSGTKGVPITAGYDSVTGNLVSAGMPQLVGEGGAMYEDIEMTTAVASLPASGTLVVMIEYLGPTAKPRPGRDRRRQCVAAGGLFPSCFRGNDDAVANSLCAADPPGAPAAAAAAGARADAVGPTRYRRGL
jgi:hypothetical protein